MINNDIPEPTKIARDILLNYKNHNDEELNKAQKIIEEYEKPRYIEGVGTLADSVPIEQPEAISSVPFVEQHFHFDKLGIEIIRFSAEGNKTKIRVNKIKE